MRVTIIHAAPVKTPDGERLQLAGFFTDTERGTVKPFSVRTKLERFPGLKPGTYDASFTGYVMEGRLSAYLSGLTPVAVQQPAPVPKAA